MAKKNIKNIKNNNKILWFCVGLFVVLLTLCYINLGLFFTIFTAIGIGIVLGIARLLDKVKNKKKQKKVVYGILIALLSLGIICLILLVAFLIYVTIEAPKFDAKLLNTKEVTILYDKDGKEITKLGSELREKVSYDELPEVLVDAIVATEDSRFFQHNGFDAPRFFKASLGQLAGQSDAGGASTLSMQVIKNTFTSTQSSGIKGIVRKFTDIYLAVFKLEKNYTKEQIIEFYVNNHFLGGNIYGVQEASYAYFGKSVSDLNLSEASILAGMFKSPNYYRPNVNPKNATTRRNTVLYLMQKHGYITTEEEKLAKSVSVESLTADVKTNATTHEYQGYIDTVTKELEEKYNVNPYVTPLLVYTNMSRDKQDAVNNVVNTYPFVDDVVQTGISVLDSGTGKILAIGAGRNKEGANTFNFATQMNRQLGSTAKPLFDYGPGIEFNNWSTYGYSTGENTYKTFVDEPYSYSNGKSIQNWDGSFMGSMTLRRALSLSRNIPAVKAFQMVDNKKIISFVESLGITPEISNGKIHEAHALGAFNGVNPLQMSGAYAAFSNGGYYNEPYSVSKIVYRDSGETVKHKDNKKQAMSDATAYMISSVLQDVQLSGKKIENVAAKTGTTNYDSATIKAYNLPSDAIGDSWVIGYTNKTVIGMWYGYQKIDSKYCLRNIPATIQRDKIFTLLANSVFGKNKTAFEKPDSVVQVGSEYYKKGHEPKNATEETTDKLDTPSSIKASFDGTNKTTISWGAVSPKNAQSEYGEFGYNIYFNNTLIDFTTSTSYTYTSSSPYGTYKVVATYKSYSAMQSDAATVTLSKPVQEDKLTLTCPSTESTNNSYTITNNSCYVQNNGSKVTATINSITFDDGVTTVSGLENGTVEKKVNAKITFNSIAHTLNSTISITTT